MFDKQVGVLKEEAFDYLLGLEVKRAVRYAFFLSLLVIDVDQRDDEEEVLRTVSGLIREKMRETDVVAISRGNGSRFRVLLTHAEPVHATLVGERIRTRIERHSFRINDREKNLTVSQGGACFPQHVSDTKGLVHVAETMLQKAKREGGNRFYLPS